MKPQDIVDAARETLGTPYRPRARINGLAIDCAGVPVYAAQKLGIPTEPFVPHGRLPIPLEMRAQLDSLWTRVAKSQMQIGDVAWIRMIETGETQHLGIVGNYCFGGFSLIHAYNHCGLDRVVEHRLDGQWFSRIVGVWRFPGVDA